MHREASKEGEGRRNDGAADEVLGKVEVVIAVEIRQRPDSHEGVDRQARQVQVRRRLVEHGHAAGFRAQLLEQRSVLRPLRVVDRPHFFRNALRQ